MRALFFTSVAMALIAGDAYGALKMKAIDVPPHGKPELLMGDIKLEGPTAMAFDSRNQPYLLNSRDPDSFGLLRTVRGGKWVTISLRSLVPKGRLPTKIDGHAHGELAVDDADAVYATLGRTGTLAYSPDQGETWQAYNAGGCLEVRVGFNKLRVPPAICRLVPGPPMGGKASRWAKRHTLSVLLPAKAGSQLKLGEPIVISDDCLAAGSGGHSGGTSFAVTTGNHTHVIYAELPKDLHRGGNPIHIATLDRRTRSVVATRHLVNAPPRSPDVHTRPTITVDSKGYLHVLSGSHGQPFLYLRSLKPDDIAGGWTKPAAMAGRQCYASIVCDRQDRLHSVYREWLPHASLGYASANAADGRWSRSATLVHGANPKGRKGYGIFYQRLFVDRASTLYVRFTFFELTTQTKGIYPDTLLMSTNGGRSWQLARLKALLQRIKSR